VQVVVVARWRSNRTWSKMTMSTRSSDSANSSHFDVSSIVSLTSTRAGDESAAILARVSSNKQQLSQPRKSARNSWLYRSSAKHVPRDLLDGGLLARDVQKDDAALIANQATPKLECGERQA
jgi:hypothetical protein